MRILYSPQVRADLKKINYQFIDETIIAEYEGLINTYNLSEMQECFNQIIVNENGEMEIKPYIPETVFSFSPIINAFRDNMLNVELINFISADAPESEKYPNWLIIN